VTSHLALSGIGLYALARRLGLSRGASLTAAGLWMASGPLLSLASLWQHFAGAAWIPWTLLAADRALAAPGPGRALAWGAVVAGQVLAGSAEMSVAAVLLQAAFAIRHLRPREPLAPGNARILGAAAVAVLFAVALSAGQWLPAVDLLRGTGREILPDWVRTYWSLHPVNLVQLLMPVLPRDLPLGPAARALLFESREPYLSSIYVGLAAVPLVAASLASERRRLTAFLAASALAATLVALGRHAFPYYFAASLLPVLRLFRYPSKAIVLVAFAWALLAGLGFDAWRRSAEERKARGRLLAIAAASALAVLAVWGIAVLATGRGEEWGPGFLSLDTVGASVTEVLAPARARVGGAAVAALASIALLVASGRGRLPFAAVSVAGLLAVAEIATFHQDLNPSAPRELIARPPAAVEVLKADHATRVYAFDYTYYLPGRTYRRGPPSESLLPAAAAMPALLRRTLINQDRLAGPTAARWGLHASFEFDALALQPRALRSLTAVVRATEETPEFTRLMRIAGVSHVVAVHTEGLEDLVHVATVPGAVTERVHVFRVPDPLPRVLPVGAARIADGLAALKALVDPGFDPAREVVLPSGSPLPAGPSTGGPAGEARILAYRPDLVRAETALGRPGYMVVADAFDPGWRATVDGREAPVLRANVAFRAVPVPAGSHVVELTYRPREVRVGLILSAAAVLACLLWALRSSATRSGAG
jgi:hypothetical protein